MKFLLVIYSRRMLTSEQRNEVAGDLHNIQSELVKTYASCQAADQELWYNLRQAFHEDPVLRYDPIVVQCVDDIEEQHNQLQALSSTSESLLERSFMMNSMQSNLNLLEERTEQISPNGPLSKVLKLFQRALASMTHTLYSVIKTLRLRCFLSLVIFLFYFQCNILSLNAFVSNNRPFSSLFLLSHILNKPGKLYIDFFV